MTLTIESTLIGPVEQASRFNGDLVLVLRMKNGHSFPFEAQLDYPIEHLSFCNRVAREMGRGAMVRVEAESLRARLDHGHAAMVLEGVAHASIEGGTVFPPRA